MQRIKKLSLRDKVFPDKLKLIPTPPEQIYVLGDIGALNGRAVALSVVGSRKITPYGQHVTRTLAEKAAQEGVVIVSGLAYGVDSVAHKAAIDSGAKTIAVLACGLDKIYPSAHTDLAKQIIKGGGAIISEYQAGELPLRQNFIARNRLVAGLGDAVLITEAAAKSGTLHTANFALEQGKTVMAVPGNINSPGSAGTNRLIQTGAAPVTSPQDIFQELDVVPDRQQEELFGATEEETVILGLLKAGVTDSSKLLAESGLDAQTFNQTLTMLEISGKIQALGAGHWGLK